MMFHGERRKIHEDTSFQNRLRPLKRRTLRLAPGHRPPRGLGYPIPTPGGAGEAPGYPGAKPRPNTGLLSVTI